MKQLILIPLVVMLLLIGSCKKDDRKFISIKGKIQSNNKIQSLNNKSDHLSLDDARKVLVFSKYYYKIFDIIDGAFSAEAQIGTGVALIFLTDAYEYIGNLSTKGLNLLPLGNLSNGNNTVIDLANLSLVGTSVIPSADPFGNTIIISDEEIASLQIVGEYFESLAKNIDADGDGIADIVTKTHLVATSVFMLSNCGNGGINNQAPVINDISEIEIKSNISIAGGENIPLNNSITLSGPVEDPYSDINSYPIMKHNFDGSYGFLATFFRATEGTGFLPFKRGTYTITIDNDKNYNIDFANIDVFNSLLIVVPTIHTNSQGKLTKITLDYRFHDGTVILNPANIITNISAQIGNSQGNRIYETSHSNTLTIETGFAEIVPSSPVDIPDLHYIDIAYQDLLGNEYIVNWNY